jgi:alpha-galactosidase
MYCTVLSLRWLCRCHENRRRRRSPLGRRLWPEEHASRDGWKSAPKSDPLANDPDVLLLRHFHNDLTSDEVRTPGLRQSMMGGVVATSDPLHELAPNRLALWNFVRPTGDKSAARLPFTLQTGRPPVAIRTVTTGIDVVLIINQTDATIRDRLTFEELSIKEPKFIFLDGHNHGKGTILEVNLAPHKSSVYVLSREPNDDNGERLLW